MLWHTKCDAVQIINVDFSAVIIDTLLRVFVMALAPLCYRMLLIRELPVGLARRASKRRSDGNVYAIWTIGFFSEWREYEKYG